jgi:hypothetical protein
LLYFRLRAVFDGEEWIVTESTLRFLAKEMQGFHSIALSKEAPPKASFLKAQLDMLSEGTVNGWVPQSVPPGLREKLEKLPLREGYLWTRGKIPKSFRFRAGEKRKIVLAPPGTYVAIVHTPKDPLVPSGVAFYCREYCRPETWRVAPMSRHYMWKYM